ncbi:TIGR02186 family protein [Indioceanicola profundi]|uniref:TIGR02186 family protein n=1 Tax=Indioceanicola profundi TaxID=2220096 RepID=UPI000E6AC468|nr:TIGR02186 family protein [Indioceanicola profundi]
MTDGTFPARSASRTRTMASALLLLLALAAFWPRPVLAQALVANLSDHLIAITTGFTGTDLLIYGTTDGPGEVAIVVQGPEGEVVVRQKDRVAGIWMNTESMTFDRVPGFYAVATSGDLTEDVSPAVLQRHEIGLDHVRLVPEDEASAEDVARFRAALIRNKQKLSLYSTEAQEITFLGQRLFDVRIHIPANVPTGIYTTTVFLIREGEVVSAQTIPLSVSKIGFSANVFEFAQRLPVLYAIVGILLAVAAGWLAGVVFRKS